MKKLLLCFFLVAGLAAWSFRSISRGGTPVDSYSRTAAHYFTADSVIKVAVSDTFSVVLRATLGTGYSWMLEDSVYKTKLRLVRQTNGQASVPGSASNQIFYFQALQQGTVPLRFKYVRPFAPPSTPYSKERRLQVIIH